MRLITSLICAITSSLAAHTAQADTILRFSPNVWSETDMMAAALFASAIVGLIVATFLAGKK